MTENIRVLIVDDSAVMRKLLTDILEQDNDIEVIGTARNGVDAIDKVKKLDPDVVTMDIEMPKMDGLTALQHIMSENPKPVIMVSAMDKRQADIVMKALDMGAVDFVSKTSGTLSLDMEKKGDTIINKVKIAVNAKISVIKKAVPVPVPLLKFKQYKGKGLVVIGASTGGPKAIPEVLARLPGNLPASVLIVQHMPEGFTKSFAERLNWYTSLEVVEAQDGERFVNGKVYVAPGNSHMTVEDGLLRLNKKEKVNFVRPSVDVLMESIAKNYNETNVVSVMLTGMGHDGCEGMKHIHQKGGKTIAQSEKTCVVYGMPKAVIDLRIVDVVADLNDIADKILDSLGVSSW